MPIPMRADEARRLTDVREHSRLLLASLEGGMECEGLRCSLPCQTSMRQIFLLALMTGAACGPSAAEERARREALAAEGRALERAADVVEERLLAGEVRLAVWNELVARHQQVSEVACRVGDHHFQDMARLFEEQAEKGRGRHRMRGWADASEPAGGIGGPRVLLTDPR